MNRLAAVLACSAVTGVAAAFLVARIGHGSPPPVTMPAAPFPPAVERDHKQDGYPRDTFADRFNAAYAHFEPGWLPRASFQDRTSPAPPAAIAPAAVQVATAAVPEPASAAEPAPADRRAERVSTPVSTQDDICARHRLRKVWTDRFRWRCRK